MENMFEYDIEYNNKKYYVQNWGYRLRIFDNSGSFPILIKVVEGDYTPKDNFYITENDAKKILKDFLKGE